MAVDVDSTKALRGVSDLQRLVRAVQRAGEHDETDWLEWKSSLDLRSKESWFHLARTILGMANRSPSTAAMHCAGLGYLVVGAQPGSVDGVESVDHAELERGVSVYVGGANGPAWSPLWISVDDRTVLVVIVEPPTPGDPIWSLRKEWRGDQAGKVFVRKVGRTVQADPDDLERLQARLLDQSVAELPLVQVDLLTAGPLQWVDLEAAPHLIAEWVARRKTALINDGRQRDRARRGEPEPGLSPFYGRSVIAGMEELARQRKQIEDVLRAASAGFNASNAFGSREEDRTLDEYIEEVTAWAQRLEERALGDLPRRYLLGHRNRVIVRVTNGGEQFLSDVQVKLDFDWEPAKGYEHLPDASRLPSEPRRFGTQKPLPVAEPWMNAYLRPVTPNFNFNTPSLRRSWIEDGSIHFTFDLGDLRPAEVDTSEPFQILLPALPDSGRLEGRWTATMRDVHGVVAGTVDLPVDPEPVDVIDLVTLVDDH